MDLFKEFDRIVEVIDSKMRLQTQEENVISSIDGLFAKAKAEVGSADEIDRANNTRPSRE